LRHGNGEVGGGDRFSFGWGGARYQDRLRRRVGCGKEQACPYAPVGLAGRRFGRAHGNQIRLRLPFQVAGIAVGLCKGRDRTQVGDLQSILDVLRDLDGVVQVLQEKGQTDSQNQAHDQPQEDILHLFGFHRRFGDLGRIDDADVPRPNIFGKGRLFETLDHQVVHLLGALSLALQDAVVDGLLVEVEAFPLLAFQGALQGLLARLGDLETVVQRVDYPVNLLGLPALEGRQFVLDGDDLGMVRSVFLRKFGTALVEFHLHLLDLADQIVVEDLGDRVKHLGSFLEGHGLFVAGFRLHPFGLRLDDLGIDGGQFLGCDRLNIL